MDQHTDQLRKLIGQFLNFRGLPCRIIEILDADGSNPLLVLRSDEHEIQPDQWGEAHRRVPTTRTVAVYDSDGQLLDEFQDLLDSLG